MSTSISSHYYEAYKTNQNLDELSDKEEIYYFAYGSNMDEIQMENRRQKGPDALGKGNKWPQGWSKEVKAAITIGSAVLQGWSLNFNKMSKDDPNTHFASIHPDEGSKVEGVLYKLDKKFIKVLDFYEGIADDQYTRELVKVRDKTGTLFHALVYIAHPDRSISLNRQGTPSKLYLDKIIMGAQNAKLSEKTITLLKNWPTASPSKK